MRRVIRPIELPSGKVVEYTENINNPLDLHRCPQCEQEKVHPAKLDEHDDGHWKMLLRCPDCEHWQIVIAPDADCDLFVDKLSEGFEDLQRDHRTMVAVNFADYIECFVQALEADGILPEDF